MGKVYIVGAGPGDPGLITVKGRELLDSAEVLVYAGSLVHPDLVASCPAPLKIDSHGRHLDEIVRVMATHARAGRRVVRLHSGDPSIYGAIVEQMDGLLKLGIDVEIIPGVSSIFAAAAALRTQLTLKGASESLIITRPAGRTLRHDLIKELSRHGETLAVFLGADRIESILERVVYPPETPAAVVYHATWDDQKVVRGTVGDIASKARAEGIDRSALIIIGKVVDPVRSGYTHSVLYS
ncbi:MAG: cobalt-precorrin-4/precorrin-4 C(11)-methyltransferase [Methanoculleaceae archaeon]